MTREYCCSAIPLVNAGIYLTLVENVVMSSLVGIFTLLRVDIVPQAFIVGALTPSLASLMLAIACFVVTAVQPLGYIGVAKEQTILYRRYVTLHGLTIIAVFSVAATWILLSVTKHSNVQAKCIQDFFKPTRSAFYASDGEAVCKFFQWVDVGLMSTLWILFALLQLYLFNILSSYGSVQRKEDHDQYDYPYFLLFFFFFRRQFLIF